MAIKKAGSGSPFLFRRVRVRSPIVRDSIMAKKISREFTQIDVIEKSLTLLIHGHPRSSAA